jgi:hypothetical protein
MIIAFKLLIWFVPIGLNIWADANGRKPNYVMMFFLRAFAFIAYGILWTLPTYDWFLKWWPVALYQLTSYWLLFELGLNIAYNIREKESRSLLYFDQKEKDSGWIDKFFARFPHLHTPAKIGSAIVMVVAIIFIYKLHA